LPDECIAQLSRIYTLPNTEIQEAFLKLCEQAKCLYANKHELNNGLDVIKEKGGRKVCNIISRTSGTPTSATFALLGLSSSSKAAQSFFQSGMAEFGDGGMELYREAGLRYISTQAFGVQGTEAQDSSESCHFLGR
jgi:hypothetical protein